MSLKIVGITGGIGSGKSYICKVLTHLGYPVYDCDSRAKALYNEDDSLRQCLISLWGQELYDAKTGLLNRARLAQIVFSDADALKQINNLVHPRVRSDFETWCQLQHNRRADIVFIESAIILGSPLHQMVDSLWAVVADEETRLRRAIERDGATQETVRARMQHQVSDEKLVTEADYVIHNEDTTPLLPQLIPALRALS